MSEGGTTSSYVEDVPQPRVVEDWEEDAEDDENVLEPDIDEEDANVGGDFDLERLVWFLLYSPVGTVLNWFLLIWKG